MSFIAAAFVAISIAMSSVGAVPTGDFPGDSRSQHEVDMRVDRGNDSGSDRSSRR